MRKYNKADAKEKIDYARVGSLDPFLITTEYLIELRKNLQLWISDVDRKIYDKKYEDLLGRIQAMSQALRNKGMAGFVKEWLGDGILDEGKDSE